MFEVGLTFELEPTSTLDIIGLVDTKTSSSRTGDLPRFGEANDFKNEDPRCCLVFDKGVDFLCVFRYRRGGYGRIKWEWRRGHGRETFLEHSIEEGHGTSKCFEDWFFQRC